MSEDKTSRGKQRADEETTADSAKAARRLAILQACCTDLAHLVAGGTLMFIDAVDMAYSAAEWSGLTDDVGDNAVQNVLAIAFMRIQK